MSDRLSKYLVERLAIELWEIACAELRGHSGPSFYEYQDGGGPMPFQDQDADFKQFWRKRARRVLRVILRERIR